MSLRSTAHESPAKAPRVSAAHSDVFALPEGSAKMLESVLFHRGDFSYAFYCALADYLEWTGALLASSSRFSAQAPKDKYPRLVRPETHRMRVGEYCSLMCNDGKNTAYDRIKHLSTTWTSSPTVAIVHPTKVTRPCFPNVVKFRCVQCPYNGIVWSHFPSLHTLNLSYNESLASIDFSGLKHCPSLTDVDFTKSESVNLNKFLSCVKHHTLKHITLSHCLITSSEIHSLLTMQEKSLLSLNVSYCRSLSAQGLFNALEQLDSKDVAMEKIEMESMRSDSFGDENWYHIVSILIQKFPKLKTLVMGDNHRAGELCCSALARSNLETLSINNNKNMCGYHEHFFNSKMSKTLKNLFIEGFRSRLRTEGVLGFLGVRISTMHHGITNEGCQSLIHVDFSCCTNLVSAGVLVLALLNPNLETMKLNNCNSCNGMVLKALGKHCPKLMHFEFYAEDEESSFIITDAHIDALASGCRKLQKIMWSSLKTTDAALSSLGRHCGDLRFIKTKNCPSSTVGPLKKYQYSDTGMLALARGCKKLQYIFMRAFLGAPRNLIVNGYCSITDVTLEALAGLPLVEIRMFNNEGFTVAGVNKFLKKTPTVRVFESGRYSIPTPCAWSDSDSDTGDEEEDGVVYHYIRRGDYESRTNNYRKIIKG